MGILMSTKNSIQRLFARPGSSLPSTIDLQRIPERRLRLLYISNDRPPANAGSSMSITISIDGSGGIGAEDPVEPSTIYTGLPITWPAPEAEQAGPLGYFPSYVGMSPDQRGAYLSWLQDTTRDIEAGYVFTFYYGLERHLADGDFDSAVIEVLHLRRHHPNKSFQAYSGAALLHACLMRGRPDTLRDLYNEHDLDYFGNSCLLLLHRQQLDLLPDMMISLARQLPGVNRRYLKSDPDLYKESLEQVLTEAYGKASYEFSSRYPLGSVQAISYPIFANYSLPNDTRAPALPNLLTHEPFRRELGIFYDRVHERTKLAKKVRSRRD